MTLRVRQADFADHSDEERRALLDDAVKQALQTIVPEKRPRYIRALARLRTTLTAMPGYLADEA